jgi:diaminopimelate epimerase
MGEPWFTPSQVPIKLDPLDSSSGVTYQLDSPFGTLDFAAASMGNPHALLQVNAIDKAEVAAIGAFLGSSDVFPEGCNIGFAQIIDRARIHLRVFERGAGETLACGSGACAAVALLRKLDRVDEAVEVILPGGVLVIKWPGVGKGIKMKGPATHVFSGTMRHE